MPTQGRRDFVRYKIRAEFDRVKTIQDDSELQMEMTLAETHLETLQIQSKHLSQFHEFEPRTKFGKSST
jgi:hypothetical protein